MADPMVPTESQRRLLAWVSNWEANEPRGPVVRARSALFPTFNGMQQAGWVRMTPLTKGSAVASLTDAGRAALSQAQGSATLNIPSAEGP